MTKQNLSSSKSQEAKQSLLNKAEKEAVINAVKEEVKKEVTAILREEIKTDVWRWCRKWFIWVVGIVGIAGFLVGIEISIPKVEKKADDYIANSITLKFSEPNIQKTLQTVASQQAKSIITEQITPEVDRARQNISSFQVYLAGMKKQYDGEYQELAKPVEGLKQRDDVSKLADDAINNGDASAYYNLMIPGRFPVELTSAIITEIYRIKSFYMSGMRFAGFNITDSESKDKEIKTKDLINYLTTSDDWKVRAKAAFLLINKKEKGVPEALINTIKCDPRLDVKAMASMSFQAVTGYTPPDIFNADYFAQWWKENQKQWEQTNYITR